MRLLLAATDADGAGRWTWVLRDAASGRALAEHQVVVDPASDEVTAIGNLYDYMLWHVSADRWASDEARILRRVGAWVGDVLLGAAIGPSSDRAGRPPKGRRQPRRG
jgi:hypothetical protein